MQITMLNTASKLDWSAWIIGIWGAIISGGAGAVSAGFGVQFVDPNKDFSSGPGGIHHLFELMGMCFLCSGVISLAKFLQTHPTPDALTINNPGPVTINTPVEPKS